MAVLGAKIVPTAGTEEESDSSKYVVRSGGSHAGRV